MCDSGGGSQSAAAERLYDAQAKISLEQFDGWKKTFQPLETKTVNDVLALNDPARAELRAQTAGENVSNQFSAARDMESRRLSGLGVNPSDGMGQASMRQYGLAEAGARAGALNSARDQSRVEGLNAEMGLIQTGRGIANTAQAGLSNAASGYQGLANAAQQQANSNNQSTGAAVGTAASIAAMVAI